MRDEYKVFKSVDPDKIANFIRAADEATACSIDDASYRNNCPIPVPASEQPKAGV